MENRIYRIDGNQLNKIRNRALIIGFKLLSFAIILTGVLLYFEWGENNLNFFMWCTLGAIFLLSLPLVIAAKGLKKIYSTLQILLNEDGIEAKAEGMTQKNIKWANMVIKEKLNGTFNLYDKNISFFNKIVYGKGWITIQPETLDIEILVQELFKHQQPTK